MYYYCLESFLNISKQEKKRKKINIEKAILEKIHIYNFVIKYFKIIQFV